MADYAVTEISEFWKENYPDPSYHWHWKSATDLNIHAILPKDDYGHICVCPATPTHELIRHPTAMRWVVGQPINRAKSHAGW